MHKLFGIVIALLMAVAASSEAFAKDVKPSPSAQTVRVEKSTQKDLIASTDAGFVPDGLAKDVMDLMNGISKPIDDSTNVTFQAGKSFRVGLTF